MQGLRTSAASRQLGFAAMLLVCKNLVTLQPEVGALPASEWGCGEPSGTVRACDECYVAAAACHDSSEKKLLEPAVAEPGGPL